MPLVVFVYSPRLWLFAFHAFFFFTFHSLPVLPLFSLHRSPTDTKPGKRFVPEVAVYGGDEICECVLMLNSSLS